MIRLTVRRRVLRRAAVLKRRLRALWNRILACTLRKSSPYRQLPNTAASSPNSGRKDPSPAGANSVSESGDSSSRYCDHDKDSSDLVALKISLLGDCKIGKTSFLKKYVGKEKEQEGLQMTGVNQMEKTVRVGGARIAHSIWEVQGDEISQDQIANACKDSVAILIMFDLTSRCTLNSVIRWYHEARKWNQTAIPILIGTKFDDFVQLPIDLQWTIASQARAYARALNATLFFSSTTYNINVTKIFKFITAKLFNRPWTVERNLTIGEPIIDF